MKDSLIVQDQITQQSIVARGRQALTRMRPQMMRLDAKGLRQINVDVALSISRALGVSPALAEYRERIVKECPWSDLRLIDELPNRALALACVHADYETASSPPEGFQIVVDEAFDSRAVLLAIARMLITCNILKAESLSSFNGGHGYHETAEDVLALVGLMHRHWETIEGKVPLTIRQLEHAQAVGERLLTLLGVREQAPAHVAEFSDLRNRAFTLMDQSYDEARRVMTYLRWAEADADSIIPSLRVRAPGSSKPAPKTADARNVADKNAIATPVVVGDAQKPVEPVIAAMGTGPVPSGLPRSNPFTTK